MSTGYVDPTADGATTTWTPSTGSAHYTLVSKATRSPTAPSTGTYIGDGGGYNGATDIFEMGTIASVSAVSSIKVWWRGVIQGDGAITPSIWVDAAWTAGTPVTGTGGEDWQSQTFSGSWDQSDLDALLVRIVGAEGENASSVYAVYAEITYTAAGGASVEALSFGHAF